MDYCCDYQRQQGLMSCVWMWNGVVPSPSTMCRVQGVHHIDLRVRGGGSAIQFLPRREGVEIVASPEHFGNGVTGSRQKLVRSPYYAITI